MILNMGAYWSNEELTYNSNYNNIEEEIINEHHMNLNMEDFNNISNGYKTIIVSVSDKEMNMKKNDNIIFTLENTNNVITCAIVSIIKYATFEELIRLQGVDIIKPGKTIDETLTYYHKIYKTNDIINYGVYAIELSVIN